jgi:hypothetical protein
MNANKFILRVVVLVFVAAFSNAVVAVEGLGASGQTKVNKALAKKWSTSKGTNDAYNQPVTKKRVVNIGSRRSGCSNVNLGTVKPGQKAPKEIVVTTKEVINVCK